MNPKIAEKFERLQEAMKTHGVQYFAGEDAKETNTLIENLGKEGNHQTVRKNRLKQFIFDPNKTVIMCSCRSKTPEDWEKKTKEERNTISRVRSGRIGILKKYANDGLAGVENIVFVGYSKAMIARFAGKNPNKNCWFFGTKDTGMEFLVPKVNASNGKTTIGVDETYKFMEKQWIKTTEKDICTIYLMDAKNCYHNTKHPELNILPFQGIQQTLHYDGAVPPAPFLAEVSGEDNIDVDVGTTYSNMHCDINQLVVAQPAAIEATPERTVGDKLPFFSDPITAEDWFATVAALQNSPPESPLLASSQAPPTHPASHASLEIPSPDLLSFCQVSNRNPNHPLSTQTGVGQAATALQNPRTNDGNPPESLKRMRRF